MKFIIPRVGLVFSLIVAATTLSPIALADGYSNSKIRQYFDRDIKQKSYKPFWYNCGPLAVLAADNILSSGLKKYNGKWAVETELKSMWKSIGGTYEANVNDISNSSQLMPMIKKKGYKVERVGSGSEPQI